MKSFAFILSLLLVNTAAFADGDPVAVGCPMPNSIKFEELYKAYSDEGLIVTEGNKKWRGSNRDEFQAQLDPVITKYLKQVEKWQKEGGFFARSGKKIALAPVWAIAPKDGASPTQTFAPHLKGLMDIGLIVPVVEFEAKEDNQCRYEVNAVIQVKPLGVRENFNEIPDLKFEEITS